MLQAFFKLFPHNLRKFNMHECLEGKKRKMFSLLCCCCNENDLNRYEEKLSKTIIKTK